MAKAGLSLERHFCLYRNQKEQTVMNTAMFAARRHAFMDHMQPGSVAILKSAPQFMLAIDAELPYRQDSDFYYLTGFEEPEAVCILAPQHEEHQYVLFVRPSSPEIERWTGKRVGVEGAMQEYGVQMAYTLEQLDEKLPDYLSNIATVYYSNGLGETFDSEISKFLKRFRYKKGFLARTLIDPSDIFDELRMVKQAEELALLRKAAEITGAGHLAAMQAAKPGMYEYEVQAAVEYAFRMHGSRRNGFETIVASGPNATTLHYIANQRRMQDGDLLLVDAGAEYAYYNGDVTRTFPVNGSFSPAQRIIYELVLEAHLAAIHGVKPGVRLEDIHAIAVSVITEGLLALGLLEGEMDKLIEEKKYREFYMHSTSHWLGVNTHDRGKYKIHGESPVLEPGMVFTIEPGIYIAEDAEGVEPRYRGIGVRIEDNVAVTADGCELLTPHVPKTVAEIEALMAGLRV